MPEGRSTEAACAKPDGKIRVLILGGIGEARELASRVAASHIFKLRYALAGRTRSPALAGIPPHAVVRSGFGGIAGLVAYLRSNTIDVLVDATHPFAARISASALQASAETGVPLARLCRPPWMPAPGDRWTPVPSELAAIDEVAARTRAKERLSVLLTSGQRHLAAWSRAFGEHDPNALQIHLRCIEPPALELPACMSLILARGPFEYATECALLAERGIDLLVSKNSGSAAARAKLDAARERGVEVLMVARPELPPAREFCDADALIAWLKTAAPGRRLEAGPRN